MRDADLFYFDPATSWDAEDEVIRRGAALFAGLPVPVEIRNQARVHLWYSERFAAPAPAALGSAAEPIAEFAAVRCCYGIRSTSSGEPVVHAPHGYENLFAMIVRPNRSPAPQHLYEAKVRRWKELWPELTVLPWV